MPIRGKTRNDPPMKKKAKGPSMFAATDSGKKPHKELLAKALKVTQTVDRSTRTLTR